MENATSLVKLNNTLGASNDLEELLKLGSGNGSKYNMTWCKSLKTKFNIRIFSRYKVVCTVTKRVHDCVIPFGVHSLNCHFSNIIYLKTFMPLIILCLSFTYKIPAICNIFVKLFSTSVKD